MSEYWKWIYDHARAKDQLESSMADVLDVKASIVLVAITFLATLSMSVFELPGLSVWLKVLQTGNTALFALGGALLIAELWPRKYWFEHEEYLLELYEYLKENEALIDSGTFDRILKENASLSISRIGHNFEINTRKEWLLKYSFRCVLLAAAVQIAILFVIGIRT